MKALLGIIEVALIVIAPAVVAVAAALAAGVIF